jgi:hypothetical protein
MSGSGSIPATGIATGPRRRIALRPTRVPTSSADRLLHRSACVATRLHIRSGSARPCPRYGGVIRPEAAVYNVVTPGAKSAPPRRAPTDAKSFKITIFASVPVIRNQINRANISVIGALTDAKTARRANLSPVRASRTECQPDRRSDA